MCQTEKLLENLPSSMLFLPKDIKIEPAEQLTSISTDIKVEPDLTIEAIPTKAVRPSPPKIDNTTPIPTSQSSFAEEFPLPPQDISIEPFIKVRSPSILQYSHEELPASNKILSPPKILNQDVTTTHLQESVTTHWDTNSMEPADLSNKKPENLTCMPEIDYIKDDDADNMSVYSNSSDPERLEVDMSQVNTKIVFCMLKYSLKNKHTVLNFSIPILTSYLCLS